MTKIKVFLQEKEGPLKKGDIIKDNELGVISYYLGEEKQSKVWTPHTLVLCDASEALDDDCEDCLKNENIVATSDKEFVHPTVSNGFLKKYIEMQGNIEYVSVDTVDGKVKVAKNGTVSIKPYKYDTI